MTTTLVRPMLAVMTMSVGLLPGARATAQQCAGTWSGMGAGIPAGFSVPVSSVAGLPDGGVVVGGFFTTAGTINARNIAQWTPDAAGGAGTWSALGAGVGAGGEYLDSVAALPNGDVVAGGLFTSAGGVQAYDVARWNGTTWTPISTGLNSYVRALLPLPGGGLVAGGAFNRTGMPGGGSAGDPVNDVARWDQTLDAWGPMSTGTDSVVTSLALLPGGDVVAGGAFYNAGGVPARSVARWNNLAGWSQLGPGMYNQFVWAVAVLHNGDIIAGGEFLTVGSASISRIARWDGSNWNPMGTGVNATVYALAVLPNGDLVAGGDFTLAGGVSASHVATWDGSAWSPLGQGTNGTVHCIAALTSGDVVVGGQFSVAGSQVCSNVARWTPPPFPLVTQQPADATACPTTVTNFTVTAAGAGSLTYQWQTESYADPSTWIPLVDGDMTVDGGPIANMSGSQASTLTVRHFIGHHVNAHFRCVVTGPCRAVNSDAATLTINSADFNNDGDIGTDADIEAFFACLAGNCCPTCGSADFNADGDLGTDADIESFFRVLGGGAC